MLCMECPVCGNETDVKFYGVSRCYCCKSLVTVKKSKRYIELVEAFTNSTQESRGQHDGNQCK